MTVTTVLNDETFIAKVREIGERFPDRIYKKYADFCEYRPDESNPDGCYFGLVMRELGFSIDAREGSIFSVLRNSFPSLSSTVMHAAARAQSCQDTGGTWGQALVEFEQRLAR